MRPAPLLLSFALPAVLLTGCGSSSSSGPVAGSTPSASVSASVSASAPTASAPAAAAAGGAVTKASYVAKAEGICSAANGKIAALDAQTPSDAVGVVAQLSSELAIADSTTGELEALPLPPADAAMLTKALLVPLRAQITAIQAYLPKLRAAAPKGEKAIEALGDPKLPTGDVAYVKAYGLPSCADALDTT